jgi:phosphotransferase system HPr (HPr) family protein
MQQIELSITNPTGLHTRPGTAFVRLAKTFACGVTLQKKEQTANAKSLVKLLQIGISQGDTITITCEGDDEKTAIEQLAQFIRDLKE